MKIDVGVIYQEGFEDGVKHIKDKYKRFAEGKPIIEDIMRVNGRRGWCYSCKGDIYGGHYCSNCGQKIDWQFSL